MSAFIGAQRPHLLLGPHTSPLPPGPANGPTDDAAWMEIARGIASGEREGKTFPPLCF